MNNKILSALQYWHDRLSQEYGENHILNIALYGSQNYNIDTPYSDIDVKAIYVPSRDEAILESNWLSKEYHNINNEHCEIKDIREMCKMYKKQNLNFLETLVTEYRWDNPKYKDIINTFKTKANDIAYYDMRYGVKSTCGQAISTIKQFRNNPNDLKKFAKVIYLYIYLNKYQEGGNYSSILCINEPDKFLDLAARSLLIGLKSNDLTAFDPHQIDEFIKNINNTLLMLENYFKNASENINPTEDTTNVEGILRKVCLDAIEKYEENNG